MSGFLGTDNFGFLSGGVSGTSGLSGSAGSSGLSGDRYRTSSSDTFTLGNAGTLTIGTDLAYSPAQSIIIVYDTSNFQESEVISYNSTTGELIFAAPTRTVGGGTYSSWAVNLDGASGGDGSSGTAGSSGSSGTAGSSGKTFATTTSLTPKVYQGASFVDAQANALSNTADAILLSDGTFLKSGTLIFIGHGYTIGNYYYLSQTIAGGVTDTYPTSGIVQQLFFVQDADTLLVDIELAIEQVVPIDFSLDSSGFGDEVSYNSATKVLTIDKYDWMDLARGYTVEPTLFATTATYDVYEYIYTSTTLYRKIMNDGSEDAFYSESSLVNKLCEKKIIL